MSRYHGKAFRAAAVALAAVAWVGMQVTPGQAQGAPAAPSAHAAMRPQWPVTPHHIVRDLDLPAQDWLPGHRGIDLSSEDAVVRAVLPGQVAVAGRIAGTWTIAIDHRISAVGPVRTTYQAVVPAVQAGDLVTAGQFIGQLDSNDPHCSDQCVHLGALSGPAGKRSYLDPRVILPHRVRLVAHLTDDTSAASGPTAGRWQWARTQSCSASSILARIWMTALECI